MELSVVFKIIIFLLGLCVGSFLNVLIDRLPTGENPFKGRSRCDHCKKKLRPLDLVPVFSFIFLRGRCRYCHKKLSIQYPLVELASGLMFVLLFLYCVQNYSLLTGEIINVAKFISLLVVLCSFLVIFIADLKYQIIPDEMLVSTVFGSVFYILLQSPTTESINFLLQYFLGIAIAGGFFYAIYLLTKGRGIGFGDVKLAPVLGLFLGFPLIIVGLYAAFLTGAVVSTILIIGKFKRWGQKIAFGPFLIFGAVVSFFWGNEILGWYISLLR